MRVCLCAWEPLDYADMLLSICLGLPVLPPLTLAGPASMLASMACVHILIWFCSALSAGGPDPGGHAVVLTRGHSVYAWGDNAAGQCGLGAGVKWVPVPVEVVAGPHTYVGKVRAALHEGPLWSCFGCCCAKCMLAVMQGAGTPKGVGCSYGSQQRSSGYCHSAPYSCAH